MLPLLRRARRGLAQPIETHQEAWHPCLRDEMKEMKEKDEVEGGLRRVEGY